MKTASKYETMITKEQFEAHVRAEAEKMYPKPSAWLMDGTTVNHWRTAYIAARMQHEWPLVEALQVVSRTEEELAGMISKAEYEGDELEQGIKAWEPVANTMRDGLMAGLHGTILEALAPYTTKPTEQP